MGTKIGYARCSTDQQDTFAEFEVDLLRAAGEHTIAGSAELFEVSRSR